MRRIEKRVGRRALIATAAAVLVGSAALLISSDMLVGSTGNRNAERAESQTAQSSTAAMASTTTSSRAAATSRPDGQSAGTEAWWNTEGWKDVPATPIDRDREELR